LVTGHFSDRTLRLQDTSDPHETPRHQNMLRTISALVPKCLIKTLRHRIEEKSEHFGPRTIRTRHSYRPVIRLKIGAEVCKWFGAGVRPLRHRFFMVPNILVSSTNFLWCRSVLVPKCPAPECLCRYCSKSFRPTRKKLRKFWMKRI